MARKNTDYTNIPKEKFEFFDRSEAIHDKKLETKPVGYFKDAMMRFCRNKSSLTAAVIIALLLAFALIVPLVSHNNYTKSKTDTTYLQYGKLLPKSKLFSWAGWDGAKRETISSDMYAYYEAMETERGVNAITKVYKADYEDSSSTSNSTFYDVRVDSYSKIGMLNLTLTKAEYEAIQDWQDENQIQVIYPSVDSKSIQAPNLRSDPNIWYKCTNKGAPKLDKDGNITPIYLTKGKDGDYHSLRIAGDDGSYRYATVTGSSASMSFKVRVDSLSYFQYRYGHEPIFLFGTNAYGQDILTRMAEGARFSLLFALIISAMMRGKTDLSTMCPLKKEMYEEIYNRVFKLQEECPELTISELCAKVIAQPAPKFYLTPGSAKVMVCKARKQWIQEKWKRLRLL